MRNTNYSRGYRKVWLAIIGFCLALGVQNTFAAAPEINVWWNLINISDGDTTPSVADGTDLANQSERLFSIYNEGDAALNISNVTFTGTHASDFSVVFYNADLPANHVGALIIAFNPSAAGTRTATINISITMRMKIRSTSGFRAPLQRTR